MASAGGDADDGVRRETRDRVRRGEVGLVVEAELTVVRVAQAERGPSRRAQQQVVVEGRDLHHFAFGRRWCPQREQREQRRGGWWRLAQRVSHKHAATLRQHVRSRWARECTHGALLRRKRQRNSADSPFKSGAHPWRIMMRVRKVCTI